MVITVRKLCMQHQREVQWRCPSCSYRTNSANVPTASRQHPVPHSSTPFWRVRWTTGTDTANTLENTTKPAEMLVTLYCPPALTQPCIAYFKVNHSSHQNDRWRKERRNFCLLRFAPPSLLGIPLLQTAQVFLPFTVAITPSPPLPQTYCWY